MITLRRNMQRRRVQRGRCELWFTFTALDPANPVADDFGLLAAFDETRLPPGGVAAPYPPGEAEIITYVYQGALAQKNSPGSSGVVHVGEFQRMTTGRGVRHKEANASQTEWVHFFRISLRPLRAGLDCAHEQKLFVTAQRHNKLCVVASHDGREGSLLILQDALVYSSALDPGYHLIHELLPGRSAWLHVIHGEASLQDIILTQGDAVGVVDEPSVSLTAQDNCEILLVDVGPLPEPLASEI